MPETLSLASSQVAVCCKDLEQEFSPCKALLLPKIQLFKIVFFNNF